MPDTPTNNGPYHLTENDSLRLLFLDEVKKALQLARFENAHLIPAINNLSKFHKQLPEYKKPEFLEKLTNPGDLQKIAIEIAKDFDKEGFEGVKLDEAIYRAWLEYSSKEIIRDIASSIAEGIHNVLSFTLEPTPHLEVQSIQATTQASATSDKESSNLFTINIHDKRTDETAISVIIDDQKIRDTAFNIVDNRDGEHKKGIKDIEVNGMMPHSGVFSVSSAKLGLQQNHVDSIKEILEYVPRNPFGEITERDIEGEKLDPRPNQKGIIKKLREVGTTTEALFTTIENLDAIFKKHKEAVTKAKKYGGGGVKKKKKNGVIKKLTGLGKAKVIQTAIPATQYDKFTERRDQGVKSMLHAFTQLLTEMGVEIAPDQKKVLTKFTEAFLDVRCNISATEGIIEAQKDKTPDSKDLKKFESLLTNLNSHGSDISTEGSAELIGSYLFKYATAPSELNVLIPVIHTLLDQGIIQEGVKKKSSEELINQFSDAFTYLIELISKEENGKSKKLQEIFKAIKKYPRFTNAFLNALNNSGDPNFQAIAEVFEPLTFDLEDKTPFVDRYILDQVQPFYDQTFLYYTEEEPKIPQENQEEEKECDIFNSQGELNTTEINLTHENPEFGMLFFHYAPEVENNPEQWHVRVPGPHYQTTINKDKKGNIHTEGIEDSRKKKGRTATFELQEEDIKYIIEMYGEDGLKTIKERKIGAKLDEADRLYFFTKFALWNRDRPDGPECPGFKHLPRIILRKYQPKENQEESSK